MFRLYDTFGLFDTVLGIVLFHAAFGLPFAIFLLRNFFIGLPKDILESARIDGASEVRIFLRLILPLGLPAIASLAIFQFLWTWNDLIVALTFGQNTQPITVWIFGQLREFGTSIDVIAPASFISLVIPLAVFFAFQRYFVQGLLAGSLRPLVASFANRYHPTVEEFIGHAQWVRERSGWDRSFVERRVQRIRAVDGGFELDGDAVAPHVLVATGHPGLLRPPEYHSAVHAYEPHEYASRVAIVGAGMAAATEWLNALSAGAEVVSVRRRPPVRRPLSAPRPLFSKRGLAAFHRTR